MNQPITSINFTLVGRKFTLKLNTLKTQNLCCDKLIDSSFAGKDYVKTFYSRGVKWKTISSVVDVLYDGMNEAFCRVSTVYINSS